MEPQQFTRKGKKEYLEYFTQMVTGEGTKWHALSMEEFGFSWCVYVLHNGEDVMYVGMTRCLPARLGTYAMDKGHSFPAWACKGWLVFWVNVESESKARKIERLMIQTFSPPWNIQGSLVDREEIRAKLGERRMLKEERKAYINARLADRLELPKPPPPPRSSPLTHRVTHSKRVEYIRDKMGAPPLEEFALPEPKEETPKEREEGYRVRSEEAFGPLVEALSHHEETSE